MFYYCIIKVLDYRKCNTGNMKIQDGRHNIY